jgi:hypothetical protein
MHIYAGLSRAIIIMDVCSTIFRTLFTTCWHAPLLLRHHHTFLSAGSQFLWWKCASPTWTESHYELRRTRFRLSSRYVNLIPWGASDWLVRHLLHSTAPASAVSYRRVKGVFSTDVTIYRTLVAEHVSQNYAYISTPHLLILQVPPMSYGM